MCVRGMENPKVKFIIANPSKCTGCSVCEYVCAMEKEWSFNPLRSRIRVVRFHPLFSAAMVCRFCEDAPCVIACPRDALKQSGETRMILIDERLCDRCGWCISACPYGAITINPETKMVMICDLCGGQPECVDFCPEEALELVTEDETSEIWISAVEELLSEIPKSVQLIKSGNMDELCTQVNEKMKRLEEKLVQLGRKEIELYDKVRHHISD